MYELPTSVEINGVDYPIRSDYRPILDEQDRAEVVLDIFYPTLETMPTECYQTAVDKCFWFISGGEEKGNSKKQPRLVDWEKDFPYIAGPVNRVVGAEIRSLEYMHWWTFISAYMEIGECTFSQIVAIRDKLARGKKLDKNEREWYKRNKDLVDIKTVYTDAEKELLKQWG